VELGGVKAVASTTTTWATMTTGTANCLIVLAATRDNDSGAASWSLEANASLGSVAERFDDGSTAGNGGGIVVETGTLATAGATGATTATVVSSVDGHLAVAIKPSTDDFAMVTAVVAQVANVPDAPHVRATMVVLQVSHDPIPAPKTRGRTTWWDA
jgi:hypothetical protein